MKACSTAEVARIVEVHKATLLRWLYNGSIPEPKRYSNGGVDFRIWTERDVERVRKFKAAQLPQRQGAQEG